MNRTKSWHGWWMMALTGGLGVFAQAAGPPPLVIRHATVFDSRNGRMLPDLSVLVEHGRIRTIAPAGMVLAPPPGATVLDARGKFLIPGLIDSHVHLVHVLDASHMTGDQVLPFYLANGVTTVRDVGDSVPAEVLVSRYAAEHPEKAPRVFLGSYLVDRQPPYHPRIAQVIQKPEEVPAFLDDMAAWGVRTVKIYVGTERPVGQRVIAEAHRRGMKVTAHLGLYSAQDAADDGIDAIEHIESILDFAFPADASRVPPPHLRAGISVEAMNEYRRRVFRRNAGLDLASPIVQDLTARLLRHRVMVDPTLVVMRNGLLLRDTPAVMHHPDNALMPKALYDRWLELNREYPSVPDSLELRAAQLKAELALTRHLYQAGVPILAGTDSSVQFCPPGYSLHQELELLVEAGLPPAAVLQAATRNGALVLGEDSNLGAVEVGKCADLVLLDADPLQDIRNTRKIHAVIRGGIVVKPARLVPQPRS